MSEKNVPGSRRFAEEHDDAGEERFSFLSLLSLNEQRNSKRRRGGSKVLKTLKREY